MSRREAPLPAGLPRAECTLRAAEAEHEAERQAYLATLDPRQRADLDPPGAE